MSDATCDWRSIGMQRSKMGFKKLTRNSSLHLPKNHVNNDDAEQLAAGISNAVVGEEKKQMIS